MQKITYPLITPDDEFKSDPDLTGLEDFLSAAIMATVAFAKDNIHYALFAIVLNPVLFLHGLNALLTATQSKLDMPYMLRSFVEPHIDINNNDSHAIVYILFIVYAQLRTCFKLLDMSSGSVPIKAQASASSSEEDDYWEG